jgi:hypothetical protein
MEQFEQAFFASLYKFETDAASVSQSSQQKQSDAADLPLVQAVKAEPAAHSSKATASKRKDASGADLPVPSAGAKQEERDRGFRGLTSNPWASLYAHPYRLYGVF